MLLFKLIYLYFIKVLVLYLSSALDGHTLKETQIKSHLDFILQIII